MLTQRGRPAGLLESNSSFSRHCSRATLTRRARLGCGQRLAQIAKPNGCRVFCEGATGAAQIRGARCPPVPNFSIVLLLLAPPSRQVLLPALHTRPALRPDCKVIPSATFSQCAAYAA